MNRFLNAILKTKEIPFQLLYVLKTVVFLLFFATFSCQNSTKVEKEISEIAVNLNIERFDQLFANSDPSELPTLKQNYPFLFSKRYADSVWINRMSDSIQQLQNKAVDSVFDNFSSTESEIYNFYQHLKYYKKALKTPRVITVLSDVDYRNKVVVTDSIVLIALDTYLGAEHEFYSSFYDYIKQNLNKDQIVSDLAAAYAERLIYQPKRATFLEEMIYFGKQLYLKDLLIPFKENNEKIGYFPEQYEWAQDNEFYIWQYFVEKELLYETDRKLLARFIIPAPFSRFNLELDSESPGRLGQYIGWQIVKSYMENNTTPLQQLLQMEATEIFNNAKFKPKK